MYVFVGLTGRRSRQIISVCVNVVDKDDSTAVSRALQWVADVSGISVVEIWNTATDKLICRLEV